MENTPDWLEVILQKNESETRVARVLDVSVGDSLVALGENYASEISRLILKVVLESGRVTKKYLIVKSMPKSEKKAMMIKEMGGFNKEIMMFRNTLTSMESLIEELGDGSEPFWCKCVHIVPNTKLFLEDLTATGHVKSKDRELGLSHSLLVLKTLGKFHALSVVLKERGLITPSEYSSNPWTRTDLETPTKQAFLGLAAIIESTWPSEKKIYGSRLRESVDKILSAGANIINDRSGFQVLNHGDLHANNVLFKFADDPSEPISCKFIDFQLSIFHSYAFDLSYFFVGCVAPDALSRTDLLIQAYRQSLVKTFEKLNFEVPDLPSEDDMHKELEKFIPFQIVMVVCLLPFLMTDKGTEIDLESTMPDVKNPDTFSLGAAPYMTKGFTKRAQSLLSHYDKYWQS